MTQLEKHQKAVRILLAIEKLETLISSHEDFLSSISSDLEKRTKVRKHYRLRIAIETDKKIRLKNYYERCFKI